MAEELLDGADVVATFEEVRGEGVTEGVAGDAFVEASFCRCTLHGPLENAFVQVMATLQARRLLPTRCRRKCPLPAPGTRRSRDLTFDRFRNPYGADSVAEIVIVDSSNDLQMMSQLGIGHLRKHCVAVAAPLRIADVDLAALEINVFDAQHQRLQ